MTPEPTQPDSEKGMKNPNPLSGLLDSEVFTEIGLAEARAAAARAELKARGYEQTPIGNWRMPNDPA